MGLKQLIVVAFYAILCLIIRNSSGESPYTIVHERAELLFYNSSLTHNDVVFKFFKINRTSFALNVSFSLVQDIDGTGMMLKLAVDKLYGSEYKRTGTTVSANICKGWKSNIFGVPQQLKEHGNLEVCSLTKNKKYNVYNFIPDSGMFPKFLPYGSYRVRIDIQNKDATGLFILNWFARVEKRVKW